ncbi:MAG: hypothetical protein Q7J25_10405 [Vicinamibacterales bacterium]|nr:hypothetical protein [Vicinamibacterales bacterium]
MRQSVRLGTAAVWSATVAGYVLLTCILTWPLPRHLRTHLLGDPTGDLGVYVWNLWIFRHELLDHAHLPFSTDHVFAYTGGADFSLHNYAPVAGILGVPLIGVLGVVGAFNVILFALVALSGLGVFVLARRLGLGTATAWCAGALFIASPVLTAKETAHFSLVIAAALPLFLWALLRTLDTRRIRDASLVGAIVAAAAYSDAYYGIYCAIMGGFLVAWHFTRVEWPRQVTASPRLARTLNLAIAFAGTLIAWRVLSGTTGITVGPIKIGLQTLYTPVLFLMVVLALRAWLTRRPVVRLEDGASHWTVLLRLGLVAVGVCLVLLLPLLVGIALRFVDNRLPGVETYWRSSFRGVDALAYFVPNPNHAWFGDHTRQWFSPDGPDEFPEFVGSFSIVAFAVIAVAAWLRILPRFWVAFTVFFAWLSLGPFMYIGGINTYVIGPWALLRYVPVIGMARAPSRFAVVAILGMSMLFAFALEELHRRYATTRWAAGVLATALAIELLPAPRTLYSAAVPDVYQLIATTGDESGRLLELPTGIRDGFASLGRFSAATQYFQTKHRRPLIGGYLSRVSPRRRTENQRAPMLRALFALSEGRELPPDWLDAARKSRDAFLRRSCVKFVIVNKSRASSNLQAFAVDALRLTLVHEDAAYVLFPPADPPACERSSRPTRWRFRDINRGRKPSQ